MLWWVAEAKPLQFVGDLVRGVTGVGGVVILSVMVIRLAAEEAGRRFSLPLELILSQREEEEAEEATSLERQLEVRVVAAEGGRPDAARG